jgi:hypothetical protein
MFKKIIAKIHAIWPQTSSDIGYSNTWTFCEVSHPAPNLKLETPRMTATSPATAEETRLAMIRAYGPNRITANRGFDRIPVDQPITE